MVLQFHVVSELGVENGVTSIPSHSEPYVRLSPHTAPSSVMVEREVAFPNSTSKPYLRLSPHTAPDVDTPLSLGTGLRSPAL
ncbi:hypothetical protein B9T16_21010 [Arthrospira sp. PCC 8006]